MRATTAAVSSMMTVFMCLSCFFLSLEGVSGLLPSIKIQHAPSYSNGSAFSSDRDRDRDRDSDSDYQYQYQYQVGSVGVGKSAATRTGKSQLAAASLSPSFESAIEDEAQVLSDTKSALEDQFQLTVDSDTVHGLHGDRVNQQLQPQHTNTNANSNSNSNTVSIPFNRRKAFIITLSTLSGLAEGICYKRFGCFPNMMTGNTVRCMSFLADGNLQQAVFLAGIISCYIGGSALFSAIDSTCKRNQQRVKDSTNNPISRDPLKASGIAALAIFILADVIAVKFHFINNVMLLPLALGYGLINAASLQASGAVVTNAISGHYTKIGMGMAERAFLLRDIIPDQHDLRQNRSKLSTSMYMILPFCVSIILSSWAYKWFAALPVAAVWKQLAPPMATVFGCGYALLFGWYSKHAASS